MNRTKKAVLIVCAVVLNSTIWLGAMAGVAYGGRLYMVDREGADLQQKLQDEYDARKSSMIQCIFENRGNFTSLDIEVYGDSLAAVGLTEFVDANGQSIQLRTSETFFTEVVRAFQPYQSDDFTVEVAQEASDILEQCAGGRAQVFDRATRFQEWIDDETLGDGWIRQQYPTNTLSVYSIGHGYPSGEPALDWLLRTVEPHTGEIQIGAN